MNLDFYSLGKINSSYVREDILLRKFDLQKLQEEFPKRISVKSPGIQIHVYF